MAVDNVVISGIGGSFPNCNDIEEFQAALYEKTNLITDLTSDWTGGLKIPSHVGRSKDLTDFDHTFLSVNLPLANTMDKTCKSFLKQGFATILDAGYSPAEVRSRNIGCFLHTTLCDEETRNTASVTLVKNAPVLVGVARTMHSNRISWYFNLHGNSVLHQGTYDNAFSTLKMAHAAVSSGQVDSALVGASSLCVSPHPSLEFKELGLLTDEPVNRPLDDNANGYIRADATVIFFLQKQSDARRSYAQLFHVGVCFFGDRLGTFLSREEKHMIKLLEDTYRECGLKPSDISYLETGSWAHKEMDTQELKLIRKVFAEGRSDPLLIGSVVGNTGFSEGSAGFVALAKCILALRTGVIAPTLHVENPNAVIDDKLKIVTENTPSKDYVAVNSFGLSGNLSHVILKKSELKISPKYPLQDDLPRLYFMASRKEEDAIVLFNKLDSIARSKYLSATMNTVFGKEIRGYMARSFAVYPFKKAPIQQTKLFDQRRPVWFLFSGMGSQWQAMGKDLMKFPVFANTIAKCAAVLKHKGLDLVNILTNEEDTTIFDNILHSFVGIASVQVALVDMMYTMGIKPDGMIGHSVGESGCAYADGCITAEEAILAAFARGRASQEATLIHGMMAAVGLGQEEITPYLPADIDVACRNSATSCTLSGPTESVEKFVKELVQKGVFAKAVNVSNIAYHSRYIKPAAPLVLESLRKIICQPKERSSKWISTSIEEHNWNSDLAKYASAEYFTNNLLSPVYFEEGAHHIPKNAILIEIAPHGLLQAIVKKSMESETLHIALTNRSKSVDNIECLLEAIGNLYLNGCEPDVNAIYPPIDYPIPGNVPSITQFITWDNSITSNVGLESGIESTWSRELVIGICSKQKYQYFFDQKIEGKVVIPRAAYIELVLDLFMKKKPKAKCIAIDSFRAFEFDNSILLKEKIEISLSITKATGNFEITYEQSLSLTPVVLATGIVREVNEVKPKIPEWKTKIGKLQFDAYLKILKYSVPEESCLEYLTKYLEGLAGEVLSNGRVFDLIDCCLKIVVIDKSDYKKPEVPYHIQEILFNVDAIRDYKKGKSVQVYYDPITNHIVSSALIMNKMKTKPFILENPEPSRDYSGPVSYFTSMKSTNLENIDVNYVGIASQLYSNDAIVDYSGVTSSGANIMGIVSYENSKINFDKFLMWKVPFEWALDEAVTVPLIYSMAYLFLIKEKPCYRTEKMKSVFIQCGDTALGEACIALALYMKKRVYTTVSSEDERNILLKRFPSLSPDHVFLNTIYDYSLALMIETEGEGVDIIVNTLEADVHLNLCWESLRMNGELIQVGVEESQNLYMQKFLNSQSFISAKTEALLSLDDATKKDLQNFIGEGIRNGVIRPIGAKTQRNIHDRKDVDFSYEVIYLKSRQRFVNTILNVNPDSSYAIIGGKDAHLVGEWLMQRGARKIVIEFSNDFRATKMSPLLKKYGAVLMMSRNNTNTISGTEAFFNDVRSFGDVAAIFAVNVSGVNCKTKLDNIKQVCESQNSNIFLSSLLCSESSNWHFELKADSAKIISKVLPSLDLALKSKAQYTTSSDFEGNAHIFNGKSSTIIDSQLLLNAHLPCQNLNDLYGLDEQNKSQIKKPCFVEENSRSLKNCFVRHVMPVFCFPGIAAASMKKLIQGLVYPTFLAQIPTGWSMNNIVVQLYKNLKEIQPRGIYTLVTESWSGIFGLKLAEYLEKKGDKVTVILLDASPYLLKEIVERNKEIFTNEYDLASYIMQNQNSINLNDQEKTILELSCKIILDRVRHHTETEVNYKFNSQCVLVTSEQSSAMVIREHYKMFKAISEVYMTSAISPYEYSSDRGVVKFVNYNVPVTWW